MSKQYECFLVENLEFYHSSHHHDKLGETLLETDDLGEAVLFAKRHFEMHGLDIIVYQPRYEGLRDYYSHNAKAWEIDVDNIIKQYHKIHRGYKHLDESPNYVLYIDGKSLASLQMQSTQITAVEDGIYFFGMKVIEVNIGEEHVKIYADWN